MCIRDSYFQGLVRDEMDWLLFSDSILVSLPLDADEDIFLLGTRVVGFVEVCAVLLRQMFKLCLSYLIPKKRDRVETGLMVNWVNLPMRAFEGLPSDLREYVYSSFVAHNKDVAPAVQPKIDNTEAFVRKIVRNVEPRPWPWMTPRMDEAFRDLESGGGE